MTEEVVEERRKVFVKNLPFGTTRDELIQLFSAIGPLKEVILPKPKANYTTVYGFVSFQEEEDTKKAIQQYNNFELCNSRGRRSTLSIVTAYQKVSRLQPGLSKLPSSSSLWSVGSQDSDKASNESSSEVHVKLPDPEAEWMKERAILMEIIEENDRKITELEKINGNHMGVEALEEKERQLLEQLQKLPQKITTLKEEIEVLKLQVKLKELEKEQNQILNQE